MGEASTISTSATGTAGCPAGSLPTAGGFTVEGAAGCPAGSGTASCPARSCSSTGTVGSSGMPMTLVLRKAPNGWAPTGVGAGLSGRLGGRWRPLDAGRGAARPCRPGLGNLAASEGVGDESLGGPMGVPHLAETFRTYPTEPWLSTVTCASCPATGAAVLERDPPPCASCPAAGMGAAGGAVRGTGGISTSAGAAELASCPAELELAPTGNMGVGCPTSPTFLF